MRSELRGDIPINMYIWSFFTSVTFAQNKIIKISPRSSDLITMRKNNIPPKTWYNYQFVPDTSKTEKKNFLIDAHYKTLGSIFWHVKKWKYFLNFPQGADTKNRVEIDIDSSDI